MFFTNTHHMLNPALFTYTSVLFLVTFAGVDSFFSNIAYTIGMTFFGK